jgi:hypothetical protein
LRRVAPGRNGRRARAEPEETRQHPVKEKALRAAIVAACRALNVSSLNPPATRKARRKKTGVAPARA